MKKMHISGVLYGLPAHEGDYQKAPEYGNATGALRKWSDKGCVYGNGPIRWSALTERNR